MRGQRAVFVEKIAVVTAAAIAGGGAAFLLGGALSVVCDGFLGGALRGGEDLLEKVSESFSNSLREDVHASGLFVEGRQRTSVQKAFITSLEQAVFSIRKELRETRGSQSGGLFGLNRPKLSDREEEAISRWLEILNKAQAEEEARRDLLGIEKTEEKDVQVIKRIKELESGGNATMGVVEKLLASTPVQPRLNNDVQERIELHFQAAWHQTINSAEFKPAWRKLQQAILLNMVNALQAVSKNTESVRDGVNNLQTDVEDIRQAIENLREMMVAYNGDVSTWKQGGHSLPKDLSELFDIYESSNDVSEQSAAKRLILELLREEGFYDLDAQDFSTFVARKKSEDVANVDDLVKKLSTQTQHRIAMVDAAGGVGKTTFAREAVSRLTVQKGPFISCIWESAKLEGYFGTTEKLRDSHLNAEDFLNSVLRKIGLGELTASGDRSEKVEMARVRLQKWPMLIVADNLETAKERIEILEILSALSGRSRAIVTTRERIVPPRIRERISLFSLRPFEGEEIREYVQQRIDLVVTGTSKDHLLSDRALTRIENTTGGNPLFMNMVIGEVAYGSPLFDVLDLMESGKSEYSASYEYIYGPLYSRLKDDGWTTELKVLHALAGIGAGSTGCRHADLQNYLNLPEKKISDATTRLDRLNWIDSQPGERRSDFKYTMHQLAEEYLKGVVQ